MKPWEIFLRIFPGFPGVISHIRYPLPAGLVLYVLFVIIPYLANVVKFFRKFFYSFYWKVKKAKCSNAGGCFPLMRRGMALFPYYAVNWRCLLLCCKLVLSPTTLWIRFFLGELLCVDVNEFLKSFYLSVIVTCLSNEMWLCLWNAWIDWQL